MFVCCENNGVEHMKLMMQEKSKSVREAKGLELRAHGSQNVD